MKVDLIVQILPPVEMNNPRSVYKLNVCSEYGPLSEKQTRTILVKEDFSITERVKLLLFYFKMIKDVEHIPSDEYVLKSLETETYRHRYGFDSTDFWKQIVGTGYSTEEGCQTYATPLSFKIVFFDYNGVERNVGITVDGKDLGVEYHIKNPI